MDCDDDELENAGEDEDHADEHPDVEEGDVGDSGYILSHLNKAIQSNSRCRAGRHMRHKVHNNSGKVSFRVSSKCECFLKIQAKS